MRASVGDAIDFLAPAWKKGSMVVSKLKKGRLAEKLPSAHDWRTSDDDEVLKRRVRAREERFRIENLDSRHPIFSTFRVRSPSGLRYSVEVRDLRDREWSCDCVDFRINGLGTCKHVEAVLLQLEARFRRFFSSARHEPSPRIDVIPDRATGVLRAVSRGRRLPASLREWFAADGRLLGGDGEAVLEQLRSLGIPELRVSQEVDPWIEERRRAEERKALRREYEEKVQAGDWPPHETLVPLFPYQREGMLHLAFTERALLADEMGLGKTIQAIAACALLHRLGKAHRVLVVTPASLKTEWEEQIQRFTRLTYKLVFGRRDERLPLYGGGSFFTIVNYEQMVRDSLDVNERMRPDVVILDEAQRIKNWSNKTSQAIKRLKSRYAFVLTGTPIENRIDELHSLMDFLNPAVLGPLFRFNRDFYELDDRGRPAGYRNLDLLQARIKPYMVRRRKADVETELPERTQRNYFVQLSPEQRTRYADCEMQVAQLANIAKRRPLTREEQEKLLRELNKMRMICDTNFIMDPTDRVCPKLGELEKVLEECLENSDVKVIVFSEWERMLELVKGVCEDLGIGYAWHTGRVPQRRRRAEINAFKHEPSCRVFLSTESGGTGLNLQNASVVINCDLPWNPARLEQRIARAWRKHQTRPVTVVNLVSENTIEHRMLATLSDKQALSDGVLDRIGKLKEIKLRRGRQSFLSKLEQFVGPAREPGPRAGADREALPADRALAFGRRARKILGDGLIACEERYPREGGHSVLVAIVDRDAESLREKLATAHRDLFGEGKDDPLAPVRLEVIDRATHEAIERLAAAGLVVTSVRATRQLLVNGDGEPAPAKLTDVESRRAATCREQGARKLKMARVLGAGGLAEEARPHMLDAIHLLGQALAVENRLPEPASGAEALEPPLSFAWRAGLGILRAFASRPEDPWEPVAAELERELTPAEW